MNTLCIVYAADARQRAGHSVVHVWKNASLADMGNALLLNGTVHGFEGTVTRVARSTGALKEFFLLAVVVGFALGADATAAPSGLLNDGCQMQN